MAGKINKNNLGSHQKRFIDLMESISGRYRPWEIWQDFIVMGSISIANSAGGQYWEEREKMYVERAKKYSKKELDCFAEMMGEVILALEHNPNQDFLGDLFMKLNFGNENNGQVFTPYSVAELMSRLQFPQDIKEVIDQDGYFRVNDPACGAGAMLIAYANTCLLNHINYQRDVLFVAQDIDFLVGMMCYIQLSLIGCSGYIVIGDTLSNPVVAIDDDPTKIKDTPNIWYTPMMRLTWNH